MKVEYIRNFGIIAHIDAGKTTLSERILFYTKKIDRMGEVHHGTATMDYMPEEQERGITISAACTSCTWNNKLYNLIDTPGHVDFTIEVARSLRVLDSAIAVFCAVSGVEAQSETVWRQSEAFSVPKLIFINKIDRIGADFNKCLEEIRTRLKANAQAISLPYIKDNKICILHLLDEEIYYFNEENQGQEIIILDKNEEDEIFLINECENLLEAIAEVDEEFFEQYLSNNYNKEDIESALRRACIANKINPAFAGSALQNIGVQPLLDAIDVFLPSPKQRQIKAHNPDTGKEILLDSDTEEFSALVFKINEIKGQKIAFLRIYSGELSQNDKIININTRKSNEVEKLFIFHANEQEEIEKAMSGEIVGVIGLEDAKTGDTYTKKELLILENIENYQPVISIILEARKLEDEEAIKKALARFCMEDPSLKVRQEEATGHFVLSGMGELHLEVFVERLKREYKLDPRKGQVQVMYREAIKGNASARGQVLKEFAEISHHGDISINISASEYLKDENTMRYTCSTKGIDKEILEAIDEAGKNAIAFSPNGYLYQGLLLEITEVNIEESTTVAGMHMAFKMAFDKALENVEIIQLEPIMFVEININEEFLGNSLAMLSHINAKIENVLDTSSYDIKKIHAIAPLASLVGFATNLRSATQGRASLSMQFHAFSARGSLCN